MSRLRMMFRNVGIAGMLFAAAVAGAAVSVHAEESADVKVVTFGQSSGAAGTASPSAAGASAWPQQTTQMPSVPRRVAAPTRPIPPRAPQRSAASAASNISPVRAAAGLAAPQAVQPVRSTTSATTNAAPAQPPASTSAPPRQSAEPITERNAAEAAEPAEGAPQSEAAASGANIPPLRQPALSTPGLEPGSPEAVAPFEQGSASTEIAAAVEEIDDFQSRRQTLGEPTARIPAPSSSGAADAVERRSTATTSGGWYKMAAGALFLASLGMIGMRYRKQRHSDYDYSEDAPATWAPPLEPAAMRRQKMMQSRRGVRQASNDVVIEENTYAEEEEPIVRAVGKRRKRRSPVLENAQSAGAFIFESAPAGQDIAFHDEIEKRLNRLNALQNAAAAGQELSRRKQNPMREEEYSLVANLASKGVPADEIARRLSMPMEEVQTVLNLR